MAKHKCPEPPPDTGRWMGTYGDMVTLLMAFFVMLFAVSETNNQKFIEFVHGLAGPFDNPAVELGLIDGNSLEEAAANPIALVAPLTGGEAQMIRDATEEFDAESAAQVEREEQLEEVEAQLEEALSDIEVPISADIRDDERGLVISISTDDVLFATGSAQLSDDGRAIIAGLAPVLVGAPNTIVVEGHTDDRPLSQAGYTNWNLSTDRAVAVVQLLGDEHALPFERVSAAGYADNRPLVPNDTAQNRSINRRVEILVVGLQIDPATLEEEEEESPTGTDIADGATAPIGSPLANILGRSP